MIKILKLCSDKDMYNHLERKYNVCIRDTDFIGYRKNTLLRNGDNNSSIISMKDNDLVNSVYDFISKNGEEVNKYFNRYIATKDISNMERITKLINQPFKKYWKINEFSVDEIIKVFVSKEGHGGSKRNQFLFETRVFNLPKRGTEDYRVWSSSKDLPVYRIIKYLNSLVPRLNSEHLVTRKTDNRILYFVVERPNIKEDITIFEDENINEVYDEVITSEYVSLAINPTKLYVYSAEELEDSPKFDKDNLKEDITDYIMQIARANKYNDIEVIFK